MTNRSNLRPSLVQPYRRGTVLVSYDVTETTVEGHQDEEPRKEFVYTSVEVTSPIEYDVLVSTIVREKYSQDEENAIVRKMIAIDTLTNDTDKEKVRADFAAYNEFAESCKTKAKAIIAEYTTPSANVTGEGGDE